MKKRFYEIENLHILFWLLKDMSWAMEWKLFGILMIIPTILIAIFIASKSEGEKLYHNIAILCWICANAFWMVCEFLGKDEFRIYTVIPFSVGLIVIVMFYIKKSNRGKSKGL